MSARVLVDTSVWIEFFRGKLDSKHKEALVLLIESQEAAITDVIKHEIVVGAQNKKDYQFLTDCLSALEEFSIEPNMRSEFNKFGFEMKTMGLFGKYTDLTIAFLAQTHGFQVYSLDQYFTKLEKLRIIRTLKLEWE